MTPFYDDGRARLFLGDCVDVMRGLPDRSVDLILTDPPYFRVKNEPWDRQWDTAAGFIRWLAVVADEWARLLKPNGSLYCFASPRMAARVDVMLGERFNILNAITWQKDAGWHNKNRPEDLRSFLSPWERIVFAEHYGADGYAAGEAGWAAKCGELRGFLFEPLRKYLADEWQRAGLTAKDANLATGTQMAGHYLGRSQFQLPTEKHYAALRAYANRADVLRREYEDLRREYEDLRRPFTVTADVPYTDVWAFPTINHYPGKHPCEKPQPLLRHAITASTRPDAVVLDCFTGTGSTGIAAQSLGRQFIGIDLSHDYLSTAARRIAQPPLV